MLGACTPRAAVPLAKFTAHRDKPAARHRFPKLPFSSTKIPQLATLRQNSSASSPRRAQYQESHFDLPDDAVDEEDDCPWEGAIKYKRNAAVSHVEYGTTLERLGLGKVASELSRKRALESGLRVVGPNKGDYGGTPVVVSVDVARRKGKLRLDGVVRTVLGLSCNSCGEPATQSVFANFTLLLSEEPVEEPETTDMGTIFAQYKKTRTHEGEDYDDEYDSLIDPEDHLHFPPGQKAIDISKNVRDLIHVEITMVAVCGPHCKGMCLGCGASLNSGRCSCREAEGAGHGPLFGLRKQMQRS